MGRRDESVPFEAVEAVWLRWRESGRLAPGSRFVPIENGDHGLTEFVPEIAEEIRAAILLRADELRRILPKDPP
jgi:hypothetical protein